MLFRSEIFIKVITSVPTEGVITTKDLDKLIYEIAAAFTGSHHDYSRLASSVAISSYHKETDPSFSNTMHMLHVDGIVNDKFMEMIESYGLSNIDDVINHDNDYNFDYKYGNINDSALRDLWLSDAHIETVERAYSEICTKCASAVVI